MSPIDYASHRLARASVALTDGFARLWVQHLRRCSHLSHRDKVRCWRRRINSSRCYQHALPCPPTCNGAPR